MTSTTVMLSLLFRFRHSSNKFSHAFCGGCWLKVYHISKRSCPDNKAGCHLSEESTGLLVVHDIPNPVACQHQELVLRCPFHNLEVWLWTHLHVLLSNEDCGKYSNFNLLLTWSKMTTLLVREISQCSGHLSFDEVSGAVLFRSGCLLQDPHSLG